MIITDEQKEILKQYDIRIDSEDINDFLLDLDATITAVGFNSDCSLNAVGLKLQLIYDQVYNQN